MSRIEMWRYVTRFTGFRDGDRLRLRIAVRCGDGWCAVALRSRLGIGRASGGSVILEGKGAGWALGEIGAPRDVQVAVEAFYAEQTLVALKGLESVLKTYKPGGL